MFEYAPAPESRAIADIQPSYGLFIGGEFVDPEDGVRFKTVNPATEEVLSEVVAAGPRDVDRAVAAARRAYEDVWSVLPARDRAKLCYRLARLVQERARELAVLETIDNGKPIRESRDVDIPLVAAHFFYYAGWADKLSYAGFGSAPRPLGVAGQVIPWNFPLLMLAWKIAPALAAGNTVVLKPAETTPLTALAFAEICQQADLPPGVVNVITGAGDTGRTLVEHPGIDKVAFTGSTEVGREIARSLAGTPKKVTLELGGKAANVVLEDAPLDQAIEGIVNGIFFNQGHVCCAGSRLLVQESIADELLERLKRRLATLRLGDPLDKNTDIGAINSPQQLEKIQTLSEIGEREGAQRWSAACEPPERGWWFPPTVFTGVTQAHRIAREEVFGPVLSVLTFRTPAEAVEKANNTPYGLSAGVWTEKGSRILWMAERLRAGVVWANTFNRFDPSSPFGGYKESGYGREGGRHGLAAYLAAPAAGPPGAVAEDPESFRDQYQIAVSAKPRPRAGGSGVGQERRDSRDVTGLRTEVRKTYKLFVGGAFPRSESGRSYVVRSAEGDRFLANAALASRKDARDAVVAARKALPSWSGATAYNRGQILYRIAEMLEGRRAQFRAEVSEAEGLPSIQADAVVDAAIDRWVWYAGWSDKIHQVHGSSNPVAGPYFDFSVPEPTGVVALVAPQHSSLLGLVSVLAPAIVGGNTCVVLASERRPLPAITLGEVLATSDLSGGVVNILTGRVAEVAPWLGSHMDVNAVDLCGVEDPGLAAELEAAAAENLKRVLRPPEAGEPTWTTDPGLSRLLAFQEVKTVWHPVGI
jgi:aldehyde dehydrogenase (NAD+)